MAWVLPWRKPAGRHDALSGKQLNLPLQLRPLSR